MRTAAQVLVLVLGCASLASASNFSCCGLKRLEIPKTHAWSECETADWVAEVRVLSIDAVDRAASRPGEFILPMREVNALLSVRRMWKGTGRTQLSAAHFFGAPWEAPRPSLEPGMRAVVFVSGGEEFGWYVTHWLPCPDGGQERRGLRLLIEEALRLQASRPVADALREDWWARARLHPSFSGEAD